MRKIKAVILAALFFVFHFFLHGQSEIRFGRITRADGLSHDNVRAISQDRFGFMWFGTQDGLCRYDGFSFKYFYNESSSLKSILSNNITAIHQSKNNYLCIGTVNKGLSIYDPLNHTFRNFDYNEDVPNCISDNQINYIEGDKNGNLWIATSGGGLNYFSFITSEFTRFVHGNKSTNSISSNEVNVVKADKKGNLWIGTNTNLDYYDIRKKTFTHFVLGFESYDISKQLSVKTIYIDKNNLIWIGTSDGLFTYDLENKSFHQYKHSITDNNTISDNSVNVVFGDSFGKIWVGTNKGLNLYLPETDGFDSYFVDLLNQNSLSSNKIECLYEDKSNILWIGTKGGGLNKLDLKRKKFYSLQFLSGSASSPLPSIASITGDSLDNIWLGTDGRGVCIFNKSQGKVKWIDSRTLKNKILSDDQILSAAFNKKKAWFGTKYGGINSVESNYNEFRIRKYNKTNDSSGLVNNQVNCLLVDRDNFLWIGTQDGLNKMIDTSHTRPEYFISYKKDYTNNNSISANDISALYQDHKGFIWIGTFSNGLNRLNPLTGKIDHYISNINNLSTISSNSINTIFEDHFGILWIGTSDGGLCMLKTNNDAFVRYSVKDGLASNEVMALLEDHSGFLWISTSKGLSKFDPFSLQFVNYDFADGLLHDGFNRSSAYMDNSGCLYFGTNSGLVYFLPSEIKSNPHIPDIIITKFTFLKNNEWFDEDYFISKYTSEKDAITLPYDKNIFSLEFAAMDFTNASKNQYQYKIEGINNNWVNNGNKRLIMFTNLEPGKYMIRIKGSNNDGIFNEEGISLPIIIDPPFYRTNSFYFILAIILLFLVVIVYSYLIKLNTNKILSLKNEQLERANQMLIKSEQSLKELNNTKDKFFSIIAHDLRNPFNPLLSLTELLDNDYNELKETERISFIKEIRHGAKKLYDLLENLLNWALTQTQQIKFNLVEIDLADIIKSNIELLQINADKKGISIVANFQDGTMVLADENMLNSIVRNLMNNAIKFSPENSTIEINLSETDGFYKIQVKDQGPGIPKESIGIIFSGFSNNSINNAKGKGSGLGLILCKEFVEKNNGKIWVESEHGKGSSFFFTIKKLSD